MQKRNTNMVRVVNLKSEILIYFSVFLIVVLAGCRNTQMRKANAQFVNYQYQSAIKGYEKVLKKTQDTCAMKNLARAYYKVNQFDKSQEWYGKVLENQMDQTGRILVGPEYMLDYTRLLIVNQQQEKARNWIEKYKNVRPNDPVILVLEEELNHYAEYLQDSSLYSVKPININTAEASFSPLIYRNGIVFTSQRNVSGKSEDDPWTGQLCYNLFYAELEENGSGNFQQANLLSGTLKSAFHDGPATFDESGKRIFFTRSNLSGNQELVTGTSDVNHLEIYTAELHGEKWMGLKRLSFDNDNFSSGHPTITPDGNTLFFASEMPGGTGGTDLYVSSRADSKAEWSTPQNLGTTINTTGNEMFPFYFSKGDYPMLYFASDGHPGMGGLDIYYTMMQNGVWSAPVHLSYPVNSSRDDFGITVYPDGNSGYFSTNRDHEKGYDQIYHFQYQFVEMIEPDETVVVPGKIEEKIVEKIVEEPVEVVKEEIAKPVVKEAKPVYYLKVTVIDKASTEVVPDARVKLENIATGEKSERNTDENGRVVMSLGTNKLNDFVVAADKKDFFNDRKLISLRELEDSDTMKLALVLERLVVNKAIRLDNIYYDFDKSAIREDAKVELDRLVMVMEDNPTLTIELSSHTDSKGSDDYNLKLSEKRALSAVEYLISKGIRKDRLFPKGYGESMLLNLCDDGDECGEEEHELNRRTEFKVLSK